MTMRPSDKRASKTRRAVGRIALLSLATVVLVIVGSLTYVYLVPLVLTLDLPGAISDGVETAEDFGEQMAGVTDEILEKASDQAGIIQDDDPQLGTGGTITGVVDGDTLDRGEERIRLSLVNTPERGESGYVDATNFMHEHCPVGTHAVYDEDDGQPDGSYGRLIAAVWCLGHDDEMPDKPINAMLVESGHARVLPWFCESSEFGDHDWAQDIGC